MEKVVCPKAKVIIGTLKNCQHEKEMTFFASYIMKYPLSKGKNQTADHQVIHVILAVHAL